MTDSRVKPLKFWIYSDASLTEVADRLVTAGIIPSYQIDSENVYAWFTARLPGVSWELNVSHKHHDGEPTPDEPICFLVMYRNEEPGDSVVEDLAGQAARALQTDAFIGTIEYLGADDFIYHPRERISG